MNCPEGIEDIEFGMKFDSKNCLKCKMHDKCVMAMEVAIKSRERLMDIARHGAKIIQNLVDFGPTEENKLVNLDEKTHKTAVVVTDTLEGLISSLEEGIPIINELPSFEFLMMRSYLNDNNLGQDEREFYIYLSGILTAKRMMKKVDNQIENSAALLQLLELAKASGAEIHVAKGPGGLKDFLDGIAQTNKEDIQISQMKEDELWCDICGAPKKVKSGEFESDITLECGHPYSFGG